MGAPLLSSIVTILLGRTGEIIFSPIGEKKLTSNRKNLFPIVVEPYLWDLEQQLASAARYKDQIMRVHYPEMTRPEQAAMLDDDRRRIQVVSTFTYGSRVLEVGSSDGTVSIAIAKHPEVKKVKAIDIRPDAAEDGARLVRDLLEKGIINKATAGKFSIETASAVEYAKAHTGETYDVVCAFEIFEHLAPQDLLPNFAAACSMLAPDGKLFMSVPNRFPNPKYEELGRSRWKWFDHRNYFSCLSLSYFLQHFFKEVVFHPLYEGEEAADSIYLIAECKRRITS